MFQVDLLSVSDASSNRGQSHFSQRLRIQQLASSALGSVGPSNLRFPLSVDLVFVQVPICLSMSQLITAAGLYRME